MADLFDLQAKLSLDSSDYERGLKDSQKSTESYRSAVMKLAQQYKQSGMDMSDAMKRAYSEIDKSQYETDDVSKKTSKSVSDNWENAGGRVSGIGEKIGNGLKKAFEIGAAAIAAATAAVTAFAKSSIDVGMNFDKSMSQVAATMGTTVDQIGNLRDFALQMGSTTQFSASQAADALNYMALAGYDASQSMEALPNVLNLAAAGGIDLARASDMVTDAQSALGLSFEQSAILVDQMAQAASKSNTSVEQLGDAILTVGGTAKNLSGGTVELATALGLLADNGIKGSEGGTALRNVILAMTPTTDAAASAFKRLSLDAYDADGNMRPLQETFEDLAAGLSSLNTRERSEILNDIFNKVDLKSANALLAAAGDEIAIVAEALDDSAISWDKYISEIRERTGDASLGITDLANDISGFLRSMGDSGMTAAEQIEVLQAEFGLTAQDAQTAFEIANSAIENHESRWEELTGYIEDAQGAAEKMAETQLDNLAGDITQFQSALEGAKIQISDGLTPALRDFVQFGTEAIQGISTSYKYFGLEGAATAIGTFLNKALEKVIEMIPELVNAGTQLLSALVNGIVNNLPMMADAVMQIVSQLTSHIADATPSFISTLTTVVSDIVTTLTNPATLNQLVQAAIQLFSGLNRGLIDALPVLMDATVTVLSNLSDVILENLPILVDTVVELIMHLADTIAQNLPTFIQAAVQIITSLAQGLIAYIPQLIPAAIQIIQSIFNALIEAAPLLLEAGITLIMSLGESIIDNLPMIVNAALEITQALLNGLTEYAPIIMQAGIEMLMKLIVGIVDHIPELIDIAYQITESIVTFLVDNLDLLIEAAIQLILALANGLIDALPRLIERIPEILMALVNALVENAPKLVEAAWQLIVTLADGLVEGLNTITEVGVRLVEGIWEGIKGAASWLWDQVTGWIGGVVDGIKGFLGIHSPSTVFADIGENMADGLGVGFGDGMSDVQRDVPDAIRDGFEPMLAESQKLIDNMNLLWEQVGLGAYTAWEQIVFVWTEAIVWFDETVIIPLKEHWTEYYEYVSKLFSDLWEDVKSIWGIAAEWFLYEVITPIIENFDAIPDPIASAFQTAWEGVTSIWGGAAGWFEANVVQPILASIQNIATALDGALKDAESRMSNMSNSVNTGSGNVLNGVPQMATGGILRRGQVALLEGKGSEAVIPLDQNKRWISALSNDLMSNMQKSNKGFGGGTNEITINVYSREGQSVTDLAEEVNRRLWQSLNEREAVWA